MATSRWPFLVLVFVRTQISETLKLLCSDLCINCWSLAQRAQKVCAFHVCQLPCGTRALVPCHSPVRRVIGAYGCRAVAVPCPCWAVIGPPLRCAQKHCFDWQPWPPAPLHPTLGFKTQGHRLALSMSVPTACCSALRVDLAPCPDFVVMKEWRLSEAG